MDEIYLKKIFEESKESFVESGQDIESINDLKEFILNIIQNTFENDFNIYIDTSQLFKKEV